MGRTRGLTAYGGSALAWATSTEALAFDPRQPRDSNGRWFDLDGFGEMDKQGYRSLSAEFWEYNEPLDDDPRAEKIFEALNEYVAENYRDINQGLRLGTFSNPKAKAWARDMAKAFKYGRPLPQDTVLYRGVDMDGPPEVGSVLKDKGFTSTSSSAEIVTTRHDRRSWALQIHAPEGTNIIAGNPGEDEIILNRNTKMKVIEVDPETQTVKVVVVA